VRATGWVRVIELGGLGPGPLFAMLLADLGADAIRIDRSADAGRPSEHPILHRTRRSVALDLRSAVGRDAVLRLIDGADALIEGFRPGVTDRLGLGPDVCLPETRVSCTAA
jgi:alpha-methylacyl-CoA racemase